MARPAGSTPRYRKPAFVALLLVLVLVPAELGSRWLASSFLADRGLVFDPRPPSAQRFKDHLENRHPVLGWPSSTRPLPEQDEKGSRRNTFFPTDAPACVSAYGDSFTWSSEVPAVDAWPNQLSSLLDCRVDNFGVGGYGTDQALLRLREQTEDRPQHLILGFTSENIRRNVNQFRALITGGTRFGFKPRFVIDSGNLELVPLVPLAETDREVLYAHPERYLQHEAFLPGHPEAPVRLRFPYTLTLLRTVSSRKLRGLFDSSTVYFGELYEPTHPSGALAVTAGILSSFAAEAEARAARPLVILIPLAEDVQAYRASGEWSYRILRQRLEAQRVPTLDFGEALVRHLDAQDLEMCDVYRRVWYAKGGCTGHFNAIGYRLLAESVAARIGPEL